jgi:hypothetical protein
MKNLRTSAKLKLRFLPDGQELVGAPILAATEESVPNKMNGE